MAAYGQADAPGARTNPFLTEYTTPYGVPPFEQIEVADYREAFLKGSSGQNHLLQDDYFPPLPVLRQHHRRPRP